MQFLGFLFLLDLVVYAKHPVRMVRLSGILVRKSTHAAYAIAHIQIDPNPYFELISQNASMEATVSD